MVDELDGEVLSVVADQVAGLVEHLATGFAPAFEMALSLASRNCLNFRFGFSCSYLQNCEVQS